MQAGNLVAVLFVLLMMIMAGVYASRRNNPNAHIMAKQLNGSEASDITESEPELEVKEKEVDKMDLIPEEEDEKDVVNDLNNKDNKNKNKKDNAENEDNETKSGDESDSEEYSMQRMVEEYQKSRTLAKKFAEIIEDISDTFKRKSIEIKRKFEPEAPPAVIRPMSMKEKLEQLNKANNDKKNNSKNNGNKKNKKNKDKQSQNKQDDNDIHFDVNFDDEKQQEMDEMDELVQKEKKEYIDNMDMEDIDNMDTNNDGNEDMVDSEDEFGEFNANNFEDFEDFDTEKIENNNGAIEIVTKKEEKLGGDENIEYVEDKNEKFNNEAIEISIEDEKVVEVEQLANNEPIAED